MFQVPLNYSGGLLKRGDWALKINLVFDYGTDVISVPDDIGVKIGKVRDHFDKWCYDKDNKRSGKRKTSSDRKKV